MNKPRLELSHIHLHLAIHSKILPIGRLSQVLVEVKGLRTYVEFEVIDIDDDTNPYPALLGIDWEIYNLKKKSQNRNEYMLRTMC